MGEPLAFSEFRLETAYHIIYNIVGLSKEEIEYIEGNEL